MNDTVEQYLKDTFGTKVKRREIDDAILSSLPIFITHGYLFRFFEIDGISVLFVERKSEIDANIAQVQKQLNLIKERSNMRVAWIVGKLSTYQRRKCIEAHINYVIPGSQIYLPELYINISDKAPKVITQREMLLPSSQLLILYHLQKENIGEMSFTEIARKLGYSKKTISKIADDLLSKDICEVFGSKEKYFNFKYSGLELWQQTEPVMQTPILKQLYLTQEVDIELPKSEDEALAHHTFLSETGHRCYAIGKSEFEKQDKDGYWRHSDLTEGDCLLQVWKYDPKVLSGDGYIDALSLYLCFRDSEDERVAAEIDKLIKERIW
ncbi:helix-turn-helix domain-containing protein [uncultured Bacteroides sp.]|uniref:MarR family transcriptional regulator n=1 Tax=uncultured Bacteroides sp. TaxID=162156 RepID=UPI002AA5EBF2|nr:helix-turn-helix domain-containing protein [uncultured Bacteroides sp.]